MKTLIYSFVAICMVFSNALVASPLPPADPVPLDGGLMALLAAGAVYGVKAYRKHNNA